MTAFTSFPSRFYLQHIHIDDPLVILIEGKGTDRRFDLRCHPHDLFRYPRGSSTSPFKAAIAAPTTFAAVYPYSVYRLGTDDASRYIP